MSADKDKTKPTVSPARTGKRRQFIFDSAKVACSVGFLGLGLGLYSRHATARPPLALRPPGAKAEEDFLGACIRCGMCVRDCPYNMLVLAKPESPVAVGTPYFTARALPCEMCEDIPCIKACPTDALDHGLTDINKARMGLAVLIDHETCLNFLGLRCDVCYRVCPVIDKAITLEMVPNLRTGRHAMFLPTVHSDACTGCGKCEQACVLEEAAIRVLPPKLAQGQLSKTFRIGWEEKKAAGRSLIDESQILDLPDRLPEGAALPNHFDPGSAASAVQAPTPVAESVAASPSPVVPSAPPGMPSAPPGMGMPPSGSYMPSTPPGMGVKP